MLDALQKQGGGSNALIGSCTIVCGPDAGPTTRLALSIYRDAGIDIPMAVLTPERCAHDSSWNDFPAVRLLLDEEVRDRERIVSFLETHRTKNALRGRSTNWYLQQYLKLSHVWNSASPIFVHDGDTIFSPALLQQQMVSPFLMTTKEKTLAYNAASLAAGIPIYGKSFVANGGIFYPEYLQMLSANPADWFIEVMERGVIRSGSIGDFSEYHIMGSLLKKNFPIRQIAIFRRFDLLVPSPQNLDAKRRCLLALKRYNAIAFETAHRSTPVKRLLGRLAYLAKYSW